MEISNTLDMVSALIPVQLLQIGKLIREQNNQFTDQPMFVVQEKREYIGNAEYQDCRIEWRHDGDSDHAEVSDTRAARLEAIFRSTGEVADGYDRHELMHVWETVVACFTEKGCQDYLAANRHNHSGELRIYADGSFRNFEFQLLRNWLMSLPEPISESEKASIEQEKLKRVEHVNAVILAISRHGRRFFWSYANEAAAEMSINQAGAVVFKCGHTDTISLVSNKDGAMHNFTHGGTLRSLVIAFAEYIHAGEKLHIDNIGLPRGGDSYIWGYSKDEVEAVLAEVKGSPMFYGEVSK
ncbi:hypothetical protein [Undibacterium crateris]|uniref:hypothetical protein n=1 Tax=Undibacterium crateris TaxID=2528175 RepID=UPI001389D28D|nr:hypothetical protein [Undibacterium crateris]NDI85102.1 hypothetical protein [Undibacterium crateris]